MTRRTCTGRTLRLARKRFFSMPIAGGTPTTLAMGQPNPTRIAVDKSNVYWVNDVFPGTLVTVPIAGGAPTTLATASLSEQTFTDVQSDGTNVYFAMNEGVTGSQTGPGAIEMVAVVGGPVLVLASGLGNPIRMAMDQKTVYWTDLDNGTVNQLSK